MRQTPVAAVGMLWFAPVSALAINANEYLFVPTVTQGEREVDLYLGAGSTGPKTGSEDNAGLGVGVGITGHWFTELAIEYRKKQSMAAGLDAAEWENTFQFGEPGQWPVDVGMVFNLERPFNTLSNSLTKDTPSVRFGPLLQKQYGKVQANFNLIFVHHFQSTAYPEAQLRYQSQIKYRYTEPLEFGVQAFGKLGAGSQTLSSYSDQVHRVGPVVLGRFAIPGERSLSYNAALLLGTTPHSPDRTLRVQIEYEF
ncbi:MAG: hypothetical protein ACYDBZ_07840 [Steroidobacteraceae bacterium]